MNDDLNAKNWVRLGTCLRHPIFATIITLLIIVTGGIGSIFSSEIRDSFPFYLGKGPWSWQAFSFWGLAALSSLAFFCRERAVNKAQEYAQALTLRQASEFERLIRTMPPSNFLAVFSNFYDSAEKVVAAAFDENNGTIPKNKETVQKSIRHILRMIATLAQTFDGGHPDADYAANIMLFVPADGISQEVAAYVTRNLIFCDESVSIQNLRGALQLEVTLSTTAADTSASPDPSMTPIALPLPKHSKNGVRYKVCPGAPLAFFEHEPDLYTDTTNLAKWCEENGDFTSEIIDQIRERFASGAVRSFISIPIFKILPEGGDDESGDPFAILNVHSSRSGLLKGSSEPFAHFVSIIRPFQVFLVRLLFALNTASD